MDGALQLTGWHPSGDRQFRDNQGRLLWLVHPPVRRTRAPSGALLDARSEEWSAISAEGGAVLDGPPGSEVDFLELAPAAAEAFLADRSEPMFVLGSFAPLGGPRGLDAFLVGGDVLDTTDFDGRRCASEQTALSLFRIALHRGGPFWDGVADVVATWVAARVEGSGGAPVHDLWGHGETHTRFLADAVLLLAAQAERDTDRRWVRACETARRGLERLTAPTPGGPWFVHDTIELAGAHAHALVLNTHVQSLI
ncbi:MAG: hypothetical protein QOJ09_495, partial [Actinomycetota bacterium]|nr:hypothetical protein [Actinomycetota bacterium]